MLRIVNSLIWVIILFNFRSPSLNNMYDYVTSQVLVAVLKRHVLIVKTSCCCLLGKGKTENLLMMWTISKCQRWLLHGQFNWGHQLFI